MSPSLLTKIKGLIADKGPIPFSEYMALCLFDSQYGYYANLTAIGARGDFVTAPELGPYFAHALARFIIKSPHKVIVELGGGTGQLAFDLLSFLKENQQLPERYIIVEKSQSLKALQQEKLKSLGDSFARIAWEETLESSNLEGILLANEFFDALPVERFIKTHEGFKRLGVDFDGEKLIEVEMEDIKLENLPPLPIGYRSEICLELKSTLQSILKPFKQGLALVVDYGDVREQYYHFMRNNGTITAYTKHQIVSVFENPGCADLTAHVDFTHLAECFVTLGWQVEFLKSQSRFLLEQGVLPSEGLNTNNYAIKRLIDPRLMGERFKVLVSKKERCNEK